MRIDIMTLFPDMCRAVFSESITGRAIAAGKFNVFTHDIRDFTLDKHNRVDDTPYGGGMGMLMQTQPVYDCYRHITDELGHRPYVIYMSPQGSVFNQTKAIELAARDDICLLCGHYEGIDERVLEEIVDEEISIGDYVLTGGELPALVVLDSVARMLPGVLPNEQAFSEESHFSGLLEYPQYTKPYEWLGKKVPDVLLSGHHANINLWRRQMSLKRTLERRPDMLQNAELDKKDLQYIERLKNEQKE